MVNDQTNYGDYLRMRDADQREIGDLSGTPKGREHYVRTPEFERLNGLACDAVMRKKQWGSVAATIKERQSYLHWQAELQTTFTDDMKALLKGAAAALDPMLGTALKHQDEALAEYKRVHELLIQERKSA